MERYGRIILGLWCLLILFAAIPLIVQRIRGGAFPGDNVSVVLGAAVLALGTAMVAYAARAPPLPPEKRRGRA